MEKVISKDGTPIAYQRSGKGAPLVLIHGTGASSERWKPVLPALEKRFSVYAVDRRGRGASGDAHTYAIQREFEDVAAVVNSIGDRGSSARPLLWRDLLARSDSADVAPSQGGSVRTADTRRGRAVLSRRDNGPTSSISRRGRPRRRYYDLHARSGQDAAAPTRTRQSVASISGPAGCRPHASARTANRGAIPTRAGAFQGRWRANTAAARQRQPKLFQGGYRGRTRRVAEQSNQGATWAAAHRHGHCARPVCA